MSGVIYGAMHWAVSGAMNRDMKWALSGTGLRVELCDDLGIMSTLSLNFKMLSEKILILITVH